MYRAFHAAVLAAFWPVEPVAAKTLVVDFDNVPAEVNSFVEDGVLVQASVSRFFWHEYPGHIDDGGTGYPRHMMFTTGGLFDAVNFRHGGTSDWLFCDRWVEEAGFYDCAPSQIHSGLVTGYRNGKVVAEQTFGMTGSFDATELLALGNEFRGLDALRIGFNPIQFRPDNSSIGYDCSDPTPCSHYNLDYVTLETTAEVPLPASLPLLAFAAGFLAWRPMRRARAQLA